MRRVVLIAGGDIARGVFDAHSLLLARRLVSRGWHVDLISFVQPTQSDQYSFAERKAQLEASVNGQSIILTRPPTYRGIQPYVDLVANALRRLLQNVHEPVVVHAENYLPSFAAIRARDRYALCIAIHADLKGAVPEESLHYDPSPLPVRLLKFLVARRLEQVICNQADSLSCVTDNFVEYLGQCYRVPRERFMVVPSCVDLDRFYLAESERAQIRRRLGYEEGQAVFAYSGSLRTRWQLADKVFNMFARLALVLPESRFLILTLDLELARQMLAQAFGSTRGAVSILSLPHEEVSRFLQAGDVGFVIRKNDHVNWVASPTKIPEYLRCGLALVATRGIGSIAEIIDEHQVGWVAENALDDSSRNLAIRGIVSGFEELCTSAGRKRRSELAARFFGWPAFIERIEERYEQLLESAVQQHTR